MRINKYIAQATGLSRRAADSAVASQRVLVNGEVATAGYDVQPKDDVTLDKRAITPVVNTLTILLNKPVGYVCSRAGQGSKTIYDLLPSELSNLKPVGRLDKESSGLLLMTSDGQLAQQLTHPSYGKTKIYQVVLDQPLQPLHHQMINDYGVQLADGPSKLQLEKRTDDGLSWTVRMHEGRNRQIRRTLASLGYSVVDLHRTQFGNYELAGLPAGQFKVAE